jgi:hypothetical protein
MDPLPPLAEKACPPADNGEVLTEPACVTDIVGLVSAPYVFNAPVRMDPAFALAVIFSVWLPVNDEVGADSQSWEVCRNQMHEGKLLLTDNC